MGLMDKIQELNNLKYDLLRLKAQLLLAKGNWGHGGRPGKVGGSSGGGGGGGSLNSRLEQRYQEVGEFQIEEEFSKYGYSSAQEYKDTVTKELRTMINDADIFIRVPSKVVEKIIDAGEFQNYHISQSSKGRQAA